MEEIKPSIPRLQLLHFAREQTKNLKYRCISSMCVSRLHNTNLPHYTTGSNCFELLLQWKSTTIIGDF